MQNVVEIKVTITITESKPKSETPVYMDGWINKEQARL